MQLRSLAPVALTVVLLASCAHTGSRSVNARPVLYPNGTYQQIGESRAQEAGDACLNGASRAGLTPEEHDNAISRGAAKGAAVVGTTAAVGSLVRGRSVDSAVSAGVKGAAVGGSAGAVAGSFQERPNMTYRRFVQRCLSERGLEVIGWQ